MRQGVSESRHARARLPVRKVVLALAGLTVVIVAFVASYSSALGRPSPVRIPVAVTGPPTVAGRLGTSPQLRVYPVANLTRARTLVEDRAVDGALALPPAGPATLLVAGGGGRAVATVLTQLGQQAAGARGDALTTTDVAPLSPADPNGTVEFYCVIFLGIGGAVGATVLGRILGPLRRPPDALARLGLVLAYAAVLSLIVTFCADIGYGALAGHFWPLFLTLWLFVAAVCLAVSGVAARAGMAVTGLLIVVLVLFGNTSSGGAVPRPLLNGFYSALNPVLPQGAALSAVRGVQYFGGRGIGASLLCLAIWAAAGLLLGAAALVRARQTAPAAS